MHYINHISSMLGQPASLRVPPFFVIMINSHLGLRATQPDSKGADLMTQSNLLSVGSNTTYFQWLIKNENVLTVVLLSWVFQNWAYSLQMTVTITRPLALNEAGILRGRDFELTQDFVVNSLAWCTCIKRQPITSIQLQLTLLWAQIPKQKVVPKVWV